MNKTEIELNFKKAGIVKDFLDRYNSKPTQNSYFYALKKYFDFVGMVPEVYIKLDKDKIKEDIKSFAKDNKDKAPLSQKDWLLKVKRFLREFDIEFTKNFWDDRFTAINGNRPVTIDKTPSNTELKLILQHSPFQGRVLFTFLSSTGMRIGEAIKLTWDDIDLDDRIVNIPANVAKNNTYRFTFFTEETKELLLEWKKAYQSYIKENKIKKLQNLGIKSKDDENRIFPFGYQLAVRMWHETINKAGHPYNVKDRSTDRYKFHIHGLRKFFKKQLHLVSNMSEGKVEFLMGHEGYCNGAYDSYRDSPELLQETFDKHCKALTVFSELHKVDTIVKPMIEASQNESNSRLNLIVKENLQLKQEIDELKILIKSLSSAINKQLDDEFTKVEAIQSIPTITKTITKRDGSTFKVANPY